MTNNQLKNKLQAILDSTENAIEKFLVQEALNRDNIQDFFSDLLKDGRNSGIISAFDNLKNTHTFFDTHYKEIETLRHEYEIKKGATIMLKADLKYAMTWFALKRTAYKIAKELGLQV